MWPVLAILSRIYALFGLNSVVVPQSCQISGMPKKFTNQSQRSPLFIAALRNNSKMLNDSYWDLFRKKEQWLFPF